MLVWLADWLVRELETVEGHQLFNLHFFFHLTRNKLPNVGSKPGREGHEFDPRLGNFFLVR